MATGPQAFYCLWQKEQIRERLFEFLSKEDICNVRLASSACCNLVTKRLFLRTHLTFSAHTFTRQSRIEALSRIGQHIEHLTFYFPHSDATFLPPLIHPESGREISFLYKPHTSMASVLERPKFANSGLGEILTHQYPPLFHAATNVPSFINAMKHLPKMRHLTIKTPGQDPRERYRRDIVDYALISLRISLERAPVKKLTKLSLSSVHPSAFIYLRHIIGFGCLPSAGRRWKQIRKLNISVESWDFYGPSPGLDHLKMIDDYIRDFSATLEKLTFTWLGRKGPCPLSLAADPLFGPPRGSQKLYKEVTSPMSPLPPAPSRKPIVFQKLRYMAVRNATMNAPQVAALVEAHQHSVREYDFENVVLINGGNWNDALAPLLNATSRSNRWTRHSIATISEIAEVPEVASIQTPQLTDDLPGESSGDSPAVSAALRALLVDGDLNGETLVDDGQNAPPDLDLPSDLEAARQASLLSPNKLKKRRITKRRRRKRPKHEQNEEEERNYHERHHRRQPSEDSIDVPSNERHRHRRPRHERPRESSEEQPETHYHNQSSRASNESFGHPHEPPQLSISPQTSQPRLFGEVESVLSTSSRRLFGEVSQLSQPGSEPELVYSPIDESDSVVDEYFRPSTPTTTPMDISAPILSNAPSMPTLLEPTVYDPTAELCSEITAVQRDIEAEETLRLVAEDADMQTGALKRAKELVLSRLGREFSTSSRSSKKSGASSKKESFGAVSFLGSSRLREGLFGKNTPVASGALQPIQDHRSMDRFLHATKGKPAWALVLGAADPIGAALCAELASRGFNVVLYARGVHALAHVTKLRAMLANKYPENKYRIVVADANANGAAAREFAGRVATSLRDVNLTVVVGNTGAGVGAKTDRSGAKAAQYLTAAVLPLLQRSAPALLVHVIPSVPGDAAGEDTCSICNSPASLPCAGVQVVACRLGEFAAAGACAQPSLLRPAPRDLARALLLHAGCGGSTGGGGALSGIQV
ncbi:hypothetical protein F5Y04DRAFT_288812 [Hypomontagnella monticulosa]|nr:hypothetical protein F5Y04DRAFT_288812 [Hypomontagnella monticulosa]